MSLEVQLVLTEKCNFRCEYCYLSFKNTSLTIEKFDNFYKNQLNEILSLYDQDTYHVVYFGGEPLLEQQLIYDIYEKIKNDQRCNYMRVVTNGALLTSELAKKYKEMGIRLSISYDGIWQDENRSSQLPKESVLREPKKLNQYVEKVHCMVRPENIDTISSNFEFFVQLGLLPDFTLIDDDVWTDDDVERFAVSIDSLVKSNINTMETLNSPIIAGFFTYWISNILRPTNIMCSITNGISLFPDGNIYPCSRFGNDKEFPLYHEDTGISDENISHMKSLGDMDSLSVCRTCEINKFCRGGCPYVQMNKGGVVPQLCEMYKILFKKTNEFIEKTSRNTILLKHIECIVREIN